MENLEFIAKILTLMLLFFSLIFTIGIIWRVEEKLDLAYKVFFIALLMFFVSEVAELFVDSEFLLMLSQIGRFLFALFLLGGVWMMRNLFRNIDGEKQ